MFNSINLDVPLVYQCPDYQTACKSVSTIEVSKYNGFDIDINEFLNNYLDTISSSDSSIANFENVFDHYFVGNPYSSHGFYATHQLRQTQLRNIF